MYRITRHCRFRAAESRNTMPWMRVGHEVYAATSIRQARRAKAHRRRQCQTLGEICNEGENCDKN